MNKNSNILKESIQTIEVLNCDTENEKSLAYYLDQIDDHRGQKGKQHPLKSCLFIIVWGYTAGLVSMRKIVQKAKAKDEKDHIFTESLEFSRGIPSHDTLSRLMRDMDIQQLEEAFLSWINSILSDVGVCLKPDDDAYDDQADTNFIDEESGLRKPPYLLYVVETQTDHCLAELKIEQKIDEVCAIPAIVRALNGKYPQMITETGITIDPLIINPNIVDT